MPASFHARYVAAIGACVVGTIIAGVLFSSPHAMTSDEALRKRFSDHQASFDSLATMAVADTELVGLGPNTVFVRNTPTQSRRLTDEEVRASGRSRLGTLLKRIGLPALSRERGAEAIWFVVESHDGSRKGYVYSLKPKEPVLGSLDDARQHGYVALAPRWFIFLQSAD